MRKNLCRIWAAGVVLGCGVRAWAVEQAVADFSTTGSAMIHRASGFLHSIDATNPPDALIAPLKTQMWRVRPAASIDLDARLHALGVQQMQIVVSDELNDYTAPFPGDGGNWTAWDNYVTSVATQAMSDSTPVAFDIWNEPDLSYFWPRSQTQYFQTWQHAVQAIRAVNPNAVIVGPSFSSYSNTKIGMSAFLNFAKANNVLPDILSWHEYTASFASDVTNARSLLSSKGIASLPISLNEIVGQSNYANEKLWQAAGPLPQYFSNLERSNVTSAAHAAWDEPGTNPVVNNGENASLDGLLTPDTLQPRSTWWVYEKYAEMAGAVSGFQAGAVKNAAGITTFDGLSTKEDGKAHILIGRFVTSTSQLDSSPVQVRLTNLNQVTNLLYDGAVRVTAEQIPDSGLNASTGPIVRMDQILKLTSGQLIVPVNSFGRTDAYFLTIASVGTWLRDADGLWSDGTGWGGGTSPGGPGSAVRFGSVATAQRTITLDSPRTVGLLTFDNLAGYRIAGDSPLTIDNGSNTALIEVLAGNNELNAPVQPGAASGIAPDLTISNGAKLKIGGMTGLRLAHLNLNTSGILDTGGNDLLLDPIGTTSQTTLVRQLLRSAYNNGQWTGPGLRSSDVTSTSLTSLGYADAATLGLTTFQGQPANPLSILVRQTLRGDANLDGLLNADDYALLDRGLARHLTGWVNGDFNYDNTVNSADYLLIDSAWSMLNGPLSPAVLDDRAARFGDSYASDLQRIIPEPDLGRLLALAFLAALCLKRPPRPPLR